MSKDSQASTAPAATAAEVSALLLQVLQNVNSAAQACPPSTPPLTPRAQAAVLRFQAISADLRTLPDGPASSFGNSSGLTSAKPARRRRAA